MSSESEMEAAEMDTEYDSSSSDLSYVLESSHDSVYEQPTYVFEQQSVLTLENSEMKLLTRRNLPHIEFEEEDEFYPDIFDAKIDETEVLIIDEISPTPAEEYEKQCKKYMQPSIKLVKTALYGGQHINLSRYMPHTTNLHFIFRTMIALPKSNITHLDLSHNPFEPNACNMLSELLQQNSSLVYLNLKGCGIGPKGAEILAEGIELSQSLLYLNLSECNLRDSGGAIIARAVSTNTVLKALNLSHNSLHVETAVEIQNMLKENQSLEALDIKWNDLFPEKEASVKIMQGLRKNTSLKFLDISWNGICGKKFATTLGGVLRANATIKDLSLEKNYLSNQEIPGICSGIARSKSLSHLKIGGNPLSQANFKQLIDAVFESKTMHSLHLGHDTYLNEFLYERAVEFTRSRREKYVKKVDGIVFGGKLLPNPPEPVDFRAIIADRAKFLAMKPKKQKLKRDMGHFMLSLLARPEEHVKEAEFTDLLKEFKAKLDEDLVSHFVKEYRETIQVGKKKIKRTAIRKMAEHYLARHPTDPPPPPPPPKTRKQKPEKGAKEGKTKGGKKK